MDYSVHLLPAGLAAASGEVVPWKPRLKGQIMVGVTVAVEGSRDFKVCMAPIHISSNSYTCHLNLTKPPQYALLHTIPVGYIPMYDDSQMFVCIYHRTSGVLYC